MDATTSLKKRFLSNPFETLNSLDLKFLGLQFNVLKDDKKIREAIFQVIFLPSIIFWVLGGSDSTMNQIASLTIHFPNLLLGKINFNEFVSHYWNNYGLGVHWSAPVIYSLLFIGISKRLSDIDIGVIKSENVAVTTGFVGMSIAVFEFFWLGSYYFFQDQHWVLSLGLYQGRILFQNMVFLIPALVIIIGLNREEYKFNLELKTWMYLGITLSLVFVWINYGLYFPINQLSVPVNGYKDGVWVSSLRFPQTLYTVDINLMDNVSVGEMFFVPNDAIHLLNNLSKIFMSLFFYSLFKLKLRRIKMRSDIKIKKNVRDGITSEL